MLRWVLYAGIADSVQAEHRVPKQTWSLLGVGRVAKRSNACGRLYREA